MGICKYVSPMPVYYNSSGVIIQWTNAAIIVMNFWLNTALSDFPDKATINQGTKVLWKVPFW
jgi:hypothetical protein